jgi:hypothetical protein
MIVHDSHNVGVIQGSQNINSAMSIRQLGFAGMMVMPMFMPHHLLMTIHLLEWPLSACFFLANITEAKSPWPRTHTGS